MRENRYVGGEPNGKYVVWDTWARKVVETYPTKKQAMARVGELNRELIEIEKQALK
ncbi:MAG: hypothetical protein M3548_09735 [Actinomycetota bacterium]|nr:hypothetical protein [Actinomycetota bacterium]